MLEFLIDGSIGAGIAVASGFVGNIMGFARGRAEKNIVNLFTTGQTEHLYCVCGHALSYHTKGGGECNHFEPLTARQTQAMTTLEISQYKRQGCSCVCFVGDPSKNPAPVTPRNEINLGKLDLG